MIFTREQLRDRHRMSHRQIDDLLHENKAKEYLDEKLKLLDFVRNFIQITDLFRENGIEFIPLKGPILSQRLYGDPAVRISHDIDLLVNKCDVSKLVSLLIGNGYIISNLSYWSEDPKVQKMLETITHHVSLIHSKTGINVEIHWSMSMFIPVSELKLNEIININLTKITLFDREFKVLNPEFEFVYLSIHGSAHAWERVKWIADIHEYSKQSFNQDKLISLIRTFKADRSVSIAIKISQAIYNTHFLDLAIKKAPERMVRFSINQIKCTKINNEGFIKLVKNILYRVNLFPQVKYKVRIVKSLMINQRDLVHHNYRYLSFYYLIRPFSFLKRRLFNI